MKHLLTALVVSVAVVGFAGCGDDGSDGSGSAAPPSAPPPPPPPPGGTGGSGGAAGTFAKATTVTGVARTYTLHVPASAMTALASGPVPLVVAFHGAGDTGSNFIAATGLTTTASSNGLILAGADAYPGNGGSRGWFLSSGQGWPGTDGYSNSYPNDLSLASRIVDEVGGLYDLDPKKVFACGFSRGAGFSAFLAEASSNPGVLSGTWSSPFAAYGACAGYDPFGGSLDMAAASPKRPVWMIHGTSDGAVPFSQGQSCASALDAAGFPTTWTPVTGAPHNWLWSSLYGHSNQDLFDFFLANPLP